jgi:Leucine-rich repeat (LRR) protein
MRTKAYLDTYYPDLEKRTKITDLDCSNKKLDGRLVLTGFTNLTHLDCSNNNLTGLDLSEVPQLKTLIC